MGKLSHGGGFSRIRQGTKERSLVRMGQLYATPMNSAYVVTVTVVGSPQLHWHQYLVFRKGSALSMGERCHPVKQTEHTSEYHLKQKTK
jgi:hypothetical protein